MHTFEGMKVSHLALDGKYHLDITFALFKGHSMSKCIYSV